MKTNIAVNSLYYTLSHMIPQVIGFFLMPVFTALLSPADYGIQNYYIVIGTYLLQFSIFGVNTYLLRHLFLCKSEDDAKKLVGEVFVITLISTSVAHLAAWVGVPLVFSGLSVQIPLRPYFLLSLGTSFFETFTILPLITLRVEEKARSFFLFSVSRVILRYGAGVVALVVFSSGLQGKMAAEFSVNALFAVLSVVILLKKSSFTALFSRFKPIIAFSWPFLVSALLFLLVDNSDRFFLERSISVSELGVYSIATVIAAVLFGVLSSIYRAIEPSVFRAHGSHDFRAKFDQVRKVYYSIIVVFSSAAVLFVGEVASIMVNERFVGAAEVAPVLVLAASIQSVSLLYNLVITAEKKPLTILYQNAIGAGLVFLCNAVLVPLFGVYGAGSAKILGFLSMSVFGIIAAKRLIPWLSLKLDALFAGFFFSRAAVRSCLSIT